MSKTECHGKIRTLIEQFLEVPKDVHTDRELAQLILAFIHNRSLDLDKLEALGLARMAVCGACPFRLANGGCPALEGDEGVLN